MIRDRRASAWAMVGRRFQRSRLSRSSEERCKGGMGRPMAMVTSMSVSWRVHPSKYFCNAFITQDTRKRFLKGYPFRRGSGGNPPKTTVGGGWVGKEPWISSFRGVGGYRQGGLP